MSSTPNPKDHGDADEYPTSSPGRRGRAGRRKIEALIVGVILSIFVVLLAIWLIASSAEDVEGASAGAGLLVAAAVGPGPGAPKLTIP